MTRWAFGLLLAGLAVGCQTAKYDVSVPHVEEFRAAPDEARYNTPPEQGYKKPPPKKEFRPGFGGPGGAGMGGGRPGGGF
ncbi:MAG: hypothetical protein ACRC8S_11710 [Fimbriiglobus sp.]